MHTEVNTSTYQNALAAVQEGLLLCHKKLCPHCKNMEKVIEKFVAQRAGLEVLLLDSEEEPDAMAALGVERVPTILIIKGGKVAGSKTGLMNPRELAALFDSVK